MWVAKATKAKKTWRWWWQAFFPLFSFQFGRSWIFKRLFGNWIASSHRHPLLFLLPKKDDKTHFIIMSSSSFVVLVVSQTDPALMLLCKYFSADGDVYKVLVSGTAKIRCDVSSNSPNDQVLLVVWYKNNLPIYRWVNQWMNMLLPHINFHPCRYTHYIPTCPIPSHHRPRMVIKTSSRRWRRILFIPASHIDLWLSMEIRRLLLLHGNYLVSS